MIRVVISVSLLLSVLPAYAASSSSQAPAKRVMVAAKRRAVSSTSVSSSSSSVPTPATASRIERSIITSQYSYLGRDRTYDSALDKILHGIICMVDGLGVVMRDKRKEKLATYFNDLHTLLGPGEYSIHSRAVILPEHGQALHRVSRLALFACDQMFQVSASELIRLFVGYGANPGEIAVEGDKNENSALHVIATRALNAELITAALSKDNKCVDIQNKLGETPLMQVIDLLIDLSSSPTISEPCKNF